MEDETTLYNLKLYTFDRNNSVKAENVMQHFDNTLATHFTT